MKCIECPDYRECSRTKDLRRYRGKCPKAKEKRVFTIGDQIRGMTDEELAKWLLTPADLCGQCDTLDFCTGCPQDKDTRCIAAVIKYLKQPVEETDHEAKP